MPPLEPEHIQFHGPLPETAEAVPAPHRFEVGAALAATPFAEPHSPFVAPPPGWWPTVPPVPPVPPEPVPPVPAGALLPEGASVA